MRRLMLLFILFVVVTACKPAQTQPNQEDNAGLNRITGQHVTELQKTACDSADKAGTCDTKLPSLGFITKEECCRQFGKCC